MDREPLAAGDVHSQEKTKSQLGRLLERHGDLPAFKSRMHPPPDRLQLRARAPALHHFHG
jgi:hypothetical protein